MMRPLKWRGADADFSNIIIRINFAWRAKPTWYLIATEDRMIPPSAQRAMAQRAGATTAEVAASHAVYMSQPRATADFILSSPHMQAVYERGPRAEAVAS